MPSQSPLRIDLADDERTILDERARAHTAPYWEVVRAKIVLLASEESTNKEIAQRLDTSPQAACKWRKRFYEEGLGGLEVKALACELPAGSGVPLSRWSVAEVAVPVLIRCCMTARSVEEIPNGTTKG
jgi:hypothetical protein